MGGSAVAVEDYDSSSSAPKQPVTLERSKPSIEVIAADIASLVIPLGLLAFAIASITRDSNEGSDEQIEKWRNVASIVSP